MTLSFTLNMTSMEWSPSLVSLGSLILPRCGLVLCGGEE